MCIHNLSIEFEKLESTESVDSAQAATATSHKRWLDIQSVDLTVKKSRSNLFSSGRAQKEKLEYEISTLSSDAFVIYYEQGELRKGDYQVNLMQFSRFEISSYSTSATERPRTIPQLTLGQNSGQTSAVRVGLD